MVGKIYAVLNSTLVHGANDRMAPGITPNNGLRRGDREETYDMWMRDFGRARYEQDTCCSSFPSHLNLRAGVRKVPEYVWSKRHVKNQKTESVREKTLTISRDVFPLTTLSSTRHTFFPLNSHAMGESFRRMPFFLACWPGRMKVR